MGIEKTLQHIQDRIIESAKRSGRDPGNIKLVAVSKTVALEKIIEALNAGVLIFGENRVQEAQNKIRSQELGVRSEKIEWHLIGNLQKNKARTAVELFDLIHSVDSAALAEEINRHAQKTGKLQRILLQVKLADEETKHGVREEDLSGLIDKVLLMNHIQLEGLMTIPPYFEDPENARPYFRKLRELADRAIAKGYPVKELSMGMSNDFEVAIEEGATMVRIGTALFGERDYRLN